MDDGATTGAMTEIALALAMAFFCILVVALVSMGAPATDNPMSALAGPTLETSRPDAGARPLDAGERLVVLHGGRFIDRDGIPVNPAALDAADAVVLAVDPALPLDQVIAARARFSGAAVRVTPLDPAWISNLSKGGSR